MAVGKPSTIEEARIRRDEAIAKAEELYQRRVAEFSAPPRESRRAAIVAENAARRAKALQLKREGKTYREIAERIGVTASTAKSNVRTALADEIEKTMPPMPEYNQADNSARSKWLDELYRAVNKEMATLKTAGDR